MLQACYRVLCYIFRSYRRPFVRSFVRSFVHRSFVPSSPTPPASPLHPLLTHTILPALSTLSSLCPTTTTPLGFSLNGSGIPVAASKVDTEGRRGLPWFECLGKNKPVADVGGEAASTSLELEELTAWRAAVERSGGASASCPAEESGKTVSFVSRALKRASPVRPVSTAKLDSPTAIS